MLRTIAAGVFLTSAAIRAEEIQFNMAGQNEEETRSLSLPREQRCGGCLIAGHHLKIALDEKWRARQWGSTKNKPLGELDVLEAAEHACHMDRYLPYGLGVRDGVNYLSGDGVPYMDGWQGAMHTGGRWPSRIALVCKSFLDKWDGDEYEMYTEFWWPAQVEEAKSTAGAISKNALTDFAASPIGNALCVSKMNLCSKADFTKLSGPSPESLAKAATVPATKNTPTTKAGAKKTKTKTSARKQKKKKKKKATVKRMAAHKKGSAEEASTQSKFRQVGEAQTINKPGAGAAAVKGESVRAVGAAQTFNAADMVRDGKLKDGRIELEEGAALKKTKLKGKGKKKKQQKKKKKKKRTKKKQQKAGTMKSDL